MLHPPILVRMRSVLRFVTVSAWPICGFGLNLVASTLHMHLQPSQQTMRSASQCCQWTSGQLRSAYTHCRLHFLQLAMLHPKRIPKLVLFGSMNQAVLWFQMRESPMQFIRIHQSVKHQFNLYAGSLCCQYNSTLLCNNFR